MEGRVCYTQSALKNGLKLLITEIVGKLAVSEEYSPNVGKFVHGSFAVDEIELEDGPFTVAAKGFLAETIYYVVFCKCRRIPIFGWRFPRLYDRKHAVPILSIALPAIESDGNGVFSYSSLVCTNQMPAGQELVGDLIDKFASMHNLSDPKMVCDHSFKELTFAPENVPKEVQERVSKTTAIPTSSKLELVQDGG